MSVAAILLAAGQSRRMGAFKPLLPFGAGTVAEACVRYLLEGGAQTVVVVTGHRHEELRQHLQGNPSVLFALNPEAESQMGASIARGVEKLPADTEAILIALVDQPAIQSFVPKALIDEWRRTGARLIMPQYRGRGGHPVLADAGLSRKLMNLDPGRGLRALFEEHRREVVRLPVESPYIARDMDTWDDYSALYEEVFHTGPPAKPNPTE